MTTSNPHVHLDLELVDLVTGDAGPDQRRELLDATRRCDICRGRADELLAAASDLLVAAPAVTPPLGFETRVASRHAQKVPATAASSPRARRSLVAAASLVLAVCAVAFAVVALDQSETGDGEVLALARPGSDDAVGTVTFSETTSGPVMIVALLDAPADIAYRCRMRLSDGSVVESPAWPPAARGAWILDVPGSIDDIEQVEIVADDTGRVWSSASP